jgi:hypothetical protein
MSADNSWWVWVILLVCSPVLVVIGLALPVAFAVLVTKAEKSMAPYFSLLGNIKNKQREALRDRRKMDAFGWKVMCFFIFSPIALVLVWWLVSIE